MRCPLELLLSLEPVLVNGATYCSITAHGWCDLEILQPLINPLCWSKLKMVPVPHPVWPFSQLEVLLQACDQCFTEVVGNDFPTP
jgi:hypothetical protein